MREKKIIMQLELSTCSKTALVRRREFIAALRELGIFPVVFNPVDEYSCEIVYTDQDGFDMDGLNNIADCIQETLEQLENIEQVKIKIE